MAMNVSLVLQLIDRLSAPARQARTSMKGIGDEAQRLGGMTVGRGIGDGIARVTREAQAADRAIAKLHGDGATRGKLAFAAPVADFTSGITGGTLAAGASLFSLGLALNYATSGALNFETAMNAVRRKVDGADTPAMLATLAGRFEKLGRDIGIPAAQIAAWPQISGRLVSEPPICKPISNWWRRPRAPLISTPHLPARFSARSAPGRAAAPSRCARCST